MMRRGIGLLLIATRMIFVCGTALSTLAAQQTIDGQPLTAGDDVADASSNLIRISGELKCWHNVVLTLQGPYASETAADPNPFTDYAMVTRFRHESGAPDYFVLGYFAADGNAAETSATDGNVWRSHLSPDKSGRWTYEVLFRSGPGVAFDFDSGKATLPFNGLRGEFMIAPSDKRDRDFRSEGRLQYVDQRYLKFAESGRRFLKIGVDSPETLLAYTDFDNTIQHRQKASLSLKTWAPHLRDWRSGDPTWQGTKGKGLIGAINYLAEAGMNSVSFLTYNAGGDGDNVWPFVERDNKFAYDCSKLDQWGIVFEHATQRGLHLHFKLQENESDDDRVGDDRQVQTVRESLDGGRMGTERSLYLQQMVARYGHLLALNWNLGEENTQSTDELKAMAMYIREIDPYRHPIVLHTFPNQQTQVYEPMLGDKAALTGLSLQNRFDHVHRLTAEWVERSLNAHLPWIICNDEQGPASHGVPCDPGFEGNDGKAIVGERTYDQNDIRKLTLWGNLMAGGAGVEYYFGYELPQNDLQCEDFRSRARLWRWSKTAIDFFQSEKIPFWRMEPADSLVGNQTRKNDRYGLAQPGKLYLVYLTTPSPVQLNLKGVSGRFDVLWFNPREGGPCLPGSITTVEGGSWTDLGEPIVHEYKPDVFRDSPSRSGETPADQQDWLVIVRRNM